MRVDFLTLAALAAIANAQNSTRSATASASSSSSATPVSTSVPEATGSLNDPVPGQGMYPTPQFWCNKGLNNETFCPGPIMQDVQLAEIFPDSKTFSDKPTNGTLNQTLQAFSALGQNVSVGQIITFVEQNFKGEGLELEPVQIQGFNANPALLKNIQDPLFRGWVSIVNSYWTLLIRQTNQSAVCQAGVCESSLIPLNNTIVVPGGRYREIYYWDSYWVLQGLLKSELYGYATSLIMNFMDFIEEYGFIPNGGRKYYLNRSQPPVFVQMLNIYYQATGNSTILARALPLAEVEMAWWDTNRSITVTSPYTNRTHNVFHYNVFVNTAPRPEGYLEDYTTVMESSPALNLTAQQKLYSELATGAESGYDYAARWMKVPVINVSDNNPTLRTLNCIAQIPVDLNSLMAGNHAILARFYQTGAGGNTTNSSSLAQMHSNRASNLSAAVLDLHWDPVKHWFYDFNTTANARATLYTPAGSFALWQNITPPSIVGNETAALLVASGARYLLGKYAGIPSVSSLLYTGLNWDFPNAWPPHAYTTIKAFQTLGRAVPNATIVANITAPFSAVARGQLGLNESQLPIQPLSSIGNSTLLTGRTGNLSWPLALEVEYANRYLTAAFCSWYSTGGQIDGLLQQLPVAELNATGTYQSGSGGVMFEKFNATDPDAAGGGGEYQVVVGFGWTNGVVLWAADEFGKYLPSPTCPLIPITQGAASMNSTTMRNTTTSVPTSAVGNNRTTLVVGNSLFAGHRIGESRKP